MLRKLAVISGMSTGTVERRAFDSFGHIQNEWLNGNHHLTITKEHYDPTRLIWGSLRVLNDDIVQPKGGFPPHPHRDMEIVSYILDENPHPATGGLEGGASVQHRDNNGNSGVIHPGDVQVMAAGSDGVIHSEFHSGDETKTLNFFQLWMLPKTKKPASTWGTRHFPKSDRANKFVVFASGFEADHPAALPINTDSRVAGARIESGQSATYALGKDRLGYVAVAKGHVKVNGVKLNPHDGAAVKDADVVTVTALDEPAEVLLVDTVEFLAEDPINL